MFNETAYSDGLGQSVGAGNEALGRRPEDIARLRLYGPGLHGPCAGEWVPMPFLSQGELLIAKATSMKGPTPVGTESFAQSRFRHCFPGYEPILQRSQASPLTLAPAASGEIVRTLPAPVQQSPPTIVGSPADAPPFPEAGSTSPAFGLPSQVDVFGVKLSPIAIGVGALALWLLMKH
jgi:hypothetical protein